MVKRGIVVYETPKCYESRTGYESLTYNMSWSLLNLPNCKVMRAQQKAIIKWKYTSKLAHQQDQRVQQAA